MKVIKIYHENCEPQELLDNDDSNLEEYSKKISKVLEASKVTILLTSSCCLITRPTKITSIIVSDSTEVGLETKSLPEIEESKEVEDSIIEITESHEAESPEELQKLEEQQEDVITDED